MELAAAGARRAADRWLRGRGGLATPCAAPGSRQPQEEEAQEEAAANRQGGAVASRGEGARGHGFPLTVRARLDKVEWGTALKYMEFIERE